MKFAKIKLFTLTILLSGLTMIVFTGFTSSSLIIHQYTIANLSTLMQSIFIQNWYFGVGLGVLSIFIISMYYGEKQQEITVSAGYENYQNKKEDYYDKYNSRI